MDTKDSGERRKLLLMIGLLLMSLILWIGREEVSEITELTRPEVGNGSREIELEIVPADQQSWKWNGAITERVYTDQELDEQMEQAEVYIREHLPREGECLERVIQGVNLTRKIPDTEVRVSWSWEGDELDTDGNVIRKNLLSEMILILTATLQCQERIEIREIPICLVPEKLTGAERWKRELTEQIEQLVSTQESSEAVVLPEQWKGVAVSYRISRENAYWVLPLLGAGCLILWKVHRREERKEQETERREEIRRQYPDFVSRFVVLLGAGMSVASVWQRLEQEYKREGTGALGEEICYVARSLRGGEQERQAYESFGRRTGESGCQRFAVILNQNLRLGSERVLEQLEYEVTQALEERKAQARKQGEEMGTKLLLPMMLQLLLILLLVMMPALMNMG